LSTAWTYYKLPRIVEKRKKKLRAFVPEPTLRHVILTMIPACCSHEAKDLQRKLAGYSQEMLLPAVSPSNVQAVLGKVSDLESQMQQFQAQLQQLQMKN
jgi:hypothetical protein